jgi:rhodanese-related sulfurtransferase
MPIRVDALEARRLIDEGITVVDVLPASVYGQEHLPGARNVPLETFEPAQVADLDKHTPLLVYCFDQH